MGRSRCNKKTIIMSANTLLVMPTTIKDRTQLHTNVDDKLIYPEIKAMQDMYIVNLLGSALFNKIQTDIANDTLAGDYKDLMDNYILDCLCWLVIAELTSTINYQIWNTGIASTNADKTSNPTPQMVEQLRHKYMSRAEHYINRCRLYLIANTTLFPEFISISTTIDAVMPQRSSFTNPIYLGDEAEYPRDAYSLRSNAKRGYVLPLQNDAGDIR
jgi:hypothetical protein